MGNLELLEAFFKSRRLADATKENYLNSIKDFNRIINKNLGDAVPEDLEHWYNSVSEKRKPGTIRNYASHLKKLHTFAIIQEGMSKNEAKLKSDEVFQTVPFSDLKRSAKKENHLRDKLVHPEEFSTLMRGARHPRIQALITMLYDSGARKGELLSLRIRDVEFRDEEGYVLIRVQGKTGERSIPLVDSIPYLKQWLQTHPDRDNLDAPLFAVTIKGRIQPMKSRSINHVMDRICQKMGLRKIYPHMLRHTRLTNLATLGTGEFNLKSYAGWTADSDMAGRYIHMAGDAHVNPILRLQGIDVENKGNSIPQIIGKIRCPNCDNEAGGASQFCPYCGYVLDPALRMARVNQNVELTQLREEVKELRKLSVRMTESERMMDEQEEMLKDFISSKKIAEFMTFWEENKDKIKDFIKEKV